jgi:hypothetical protein
VPNAKNGLGLVGDSGGEPTPFYDCLEEDARQSGT